MLPIKATGDTDLRARVGMAVRPPMALQQTSEKLHNPHSSGSLSLKSTPQTPAARYGYWLHLWEGRCLLAIGTRAHSSVRLESRSQLPEQTEAWLGGPAVRRSLSAPRTAAGRHLAITFADDDIGRAEVLGQDAFGVPDRRCVCREFCGLHGNWRTVAVVTVKGI